MATTIRRAHYFAWAGAFGLLSLIMLSVGLETAFHFLGSAIDGPFQLYNALRRIAAGQRGGVDFQFFHGIGIPYLHYLPYRLLGGNFLASELSRQLVTIVLYPAVLVLFFRVFTRDWLRTLALSTLVLALSIALRMTSMLVAVNSLLGVRSAVATLVPVAMCVAVAPRWRNLLTGLALGGALVLGTEQGLAVIMAFVATNALAIWRSTSRRARLFDVGSALVIAVVTIVLAMTLIGGVTGLEGALRYNLKLVPMDQYWYFGAPPNIFVFSWTALPVFFAKQPRIPISFALAAVLAWIHLRRLWREPDGDAGRQHAALAVLAVYGMISCASLLGIYVAVYVQPCLRVVLLLGALELDRILPARDQRLARPPLIGVSRTLVMTIAASAIVMTVAVTSVITALITTIPHIVVDHVFRHEGQNMGGFWPETMTSGQRIFDAHRGPNGKPPTLWSTYAGLLEAQNGIFQPSFDYVIHALGPENRAKYVADFQRLEPTLVQTVLPGYSQYEAWIEQTSWEFYAKLLRDYRIAGATPWSIFWERDSVVHPDPIPYLDAEVTADSVSIPAVPLAPKQPNVVLMEVELAYEVRNPLHVLPVVGAMPRYLVRVGNALNRYSITLDPYVKTMRFPVLSIRGRDPTLIFGTYSLLPGASVKVKRMRVWLVPVKVENGPWMDNLLAQQTERSTQQ